LLDKVTRLNNTRLERDVRSRLGHILLRAGRTDEAAAEFNRTLELGAGGGRRDAAYLARLGLGLVAVARKDWKAGVPHFRAAVEVAEEVRRGVRGPESKVSQFAGGATEPYEGLARCLAELGDAEGALQVAERGKAR